MKNIKLITITFLFSSFLVGCGMKGPLYQTKTAKSEAAVIETAQQTSAIEAPTPESDTVIVTSEPLSAIEKPITAIEENTQNIDSAIVDSDINASSNTQLAEAQLTNQDIKIPDYLFTTKAQLSLIPPHYYTIQLAALDSIESLQNFVKQYNLPQKGVYLYKTTHNNSPRYIIIYGEYETRKLALVASESLPATFADMKTWVKQYKLVQQDLTANQ
jgi:DamX protein